MNNSEEALIIRFFRYKKNLIFPTMIIMTIIGSILSWLTIDYFCFNLIPNIWNWGFEPIIWWKAILAFFADFYLGFMVFILVMLFLFSFNWHLFKIYIEDMEKYHYDKYLKTIHYPYPELYIFLSHLSKDKEKITTVKDELDNFNIKCFIAHENIEANQEWENEIIKALRQMDMLVAFMSEDFKESNWCSQEIGFALGKNVPVISINLGIAPYGFIAKKQALDTSWNNVAKDIIDTLFKEFMHIDKVVDIYIYQMSKCQSFDVGNNLSIYLPHLVKLTNIQVNQMIEIYNSNTQLNGCFGFNGYENQEGLVYHLNRLQDRIKYEMDTESCKIRQKT